MSYNCGLGHDIRFQGHQNDRLVGRIDFPVSRELGKVGGEKSGGGVDGRLHFARRPVDIAAQIELQHDGRGAYRASGRHFRDARDAGELLLEGSGHRTRPLHPDWLPAGRR